MRILLITAALMLAAPAWAKDTKSEPLGTWRYRDPARKVKVIVIGGSISAWPSGNFSDFLEGACRNVEVENKSQVGYGAMQLKWRFKRQFLQNPNVKLKDKTFEYWLLHSGGLNSIFSPEQTIKHTAESFAWAHDAGMKVVAFSLTPWGSDKDARWRGLKGLEYHDKTRKVVDFVLGKLSRTEALGAEAGPKDGAAWKKSELPDLAVDLFDSSLRWRDAALRDKARLAKALAANRRLRAAYPDVEAAAARAAEVPRWFLKPAYRSFDHIHPNTEGHRVIAEAACPSLPASWGCDCAVIPKLVWKGKIVRP